MSDLVAEYIGKLLVVASPFLLKLWAPGTSLAFAGVTPEYKEAVASGSFLFLFFLLEVRGELKTRAGRADFLDEYLDSVLAPVHENLGTNLRVNVMVARRWPLLVVRTFEWIASRGFGPGTHEDVGLWLTEYQGVCGKAFRAQAIQWYDFRQAEEFTPSRWPWFNPFGLTGAQYHRTRGVKAILSVPLIRRGGKPGNPTFAKVGVLNVDAISDAGADWLAQNREALGRELLRTGAVLAAVA